MVTTDSQPTDTLEPSHPKRAKLDALPETLESPEHINLPHSPTHKHQENGDESAGEHPAAIAKCPKNGRPWEHAPGPLNHEWLDYTKFAKPIKLPELPYWILPIRAPVENRQSFSWLEEDEMFTWEHVIAQVERGMEEYSEGKRCRIVACYDLTGTNVDSRKYYRGSQLAYRYGIQYIKVKTNGGQGTVPGHHLVNYFRSEMRGHKQMEDDLRFDMERDGRQPQIVPIVLVHCTHGVNRTGYFICSFLIKELRYDPDKAIEIFETARGHSIRYAHYKDELRALATRERQPRRSRWENRDPPSHQNSSSSSSRSRHNSQTPSRQPSENIPSRQRNPLTEADGSDDLILMPTAPGYGTTSRRNRKKSSETRSELAGGEPASERVIVID